MSISIPIKYIKGEDDNVFRPCLIIEAPSSEPDLYGYVLKQPKEYAYETAKSIVLEHGNEWDNETKSFRFMFEIGEKIPGKKSRRYRYTDKEIIQMYGRLESKTYDERLKRRQDIISSDPGKLIRARYAIYEERDKRIESDWLLSPDADHTWVYAIDHDPLQDTGKHSKKARYFSIEESIPSMIFPSSESIPIR